MQALRVEEAPESMAETVINDMPYLVKSLPVKDVENLSILLVDDDDVAVENVMRSMDKCGVNFPVVVADDGQDALDILRNQHASKKIEAPYLVLLDLKMPGMDGFEFLTEVRKDEALEDTEVFILTTSDSNADRAKAYHEDVAGYLLKDSTTMFNWLFSSLPKYTKFKNFLKTPQKNVFEEETL